TTIAESPRGDSVIPTLFGTGGATAKEKTRCACAHRVPGLLGWSIYHSRFHCGDRERQNRAQLESALERGFALFRRGILGQGRNDLRGRAGGGTNDAQVRGLEQGETARAADARDHRGVIAGREDY